MQNSQAVLDVLEFVENRAKGGEKKADVEEGSTATIAAENNDINNWSMDDLLNKSDDPEKVYINAEKIGEGAAGEVFLATHSQTGDKVHTTRSFTLYPTPSS